MTASRRKVKLCPDILWNFDKGSGKYEGNPKKLNIQQTSSSASASYWPLLEKKNETQFCSNPGENWVFWRPFLALRRTLRCMTPFRSSWRDFLSLDHDDGGLVIEDKEDKLTSQPSIMCFHCKLSLRDCLAPGAQKIAECWLAEKGITTELKIDVYWRGKPRLESGFRGWTCESVIYAIYGEDRGSTIQIKEDAFIEEKNWPDILQIRPVLVKKIEENRPSDILSYRRSKALSQETTLKFEDMGLMTEDNRRFWSLFPITLPVVWALIAGGWWLNHEHCVRRQKSEDWRNKMSVNTMKSADWVSSFH